MYKLIKKTKNRVIFSSLILVSLILSSCDFDFLYKKSVPVEEPKTIFFMGKEYDYDLRLDDNFYISDFATTSEIVAKKAYVNFACPYATYSIINDGFAMIYKHNPNVCKTIEIGKEYVFKSTVSFIRHTVCINAGHGTKGGSNIKTFSHPDFSPKVSGGTTAEGSILSIAVSDGTVLDNGMKESSVNLMVALVLKEKLLAEGYDVLMIRENDDVRLDNIARTVIANNNSDIHIAIHMDSTDSDKGIFYISPSKDKRYLSMEPVKSNYKNIDTLGKIIIETYREMGEKIWQDKGVLQGDLTQISFSTNPSVDIELGDKATEITKERIYDLAEGLKKGINNFFILEKSS